MALMLWLCRFIKNHSMWYVHVVHRQAAESMSPSLEHVLFSVGGKLTRQISAEVKEVHRHQESKTKMVDSSI